jgi:hypothetical protein
MELIAEFTKGAIFYTIQNPTHIQTYTLWNFSSIIIPIYSILLYATFVCFEVCDNGDSFKNTALDIQHQLRCSGLTGYYHSICLEGLRTTTQDLSQVSKCPSRN